MTVWLDVTTIMTWNRPPVGIVRTELELARFVIDADSPDRFSLCYFEKEGGDFFRLMKGDYGYRKILNLLGKLERSGPTSLSDIVLEIKIAAPPKKQNFFGKILRRNPDLRYALDPIINDSIRGWVFDAQRPLHRIEVEFCSDDGKQLYSSTASTYRPDLEKAHGTDGCYSFEFPLRKILSDFNPGSGEHVIRIYSNHNGRNLIGSFVVDGDLWEQCYEGVSLGGEVLHLCDKDVYVTGGLDWDFKDFSKIYSKKMATGFHVVGFCYDLIPVKFPQYCVADVSSIFSNYFVDLNWAVDTLICISKCTQRDIIEFTSAAGCAIPKTYVVRLGSDISVKTSYLKSNPEIKEILGEKYILFVSTIERRKNHEVLYRAYTRLVDKGVKGLPKLVFIGMTGWGVNDFLNEIGLDPRVKGLISIFNRVSDEELALLYKNSLFTVFPSLYEGWGLPVAEALAYGKYCLVSNRGSLPEIAGDLLDYLDPWSVKDWAEQIEHLVKSPDVLRRKEDRIRNEFKPDSWNACAKSVFEIAGELNQVGSTKVI